MNRIPPEIVTERLIIYPMGPEFAEAVNAGVCETFDQLQLWMPWAKSLPSLADSLRTLTEAREKYEQGEDNSVVALLKSDRSLVLCSGLHPRQPPLSQPLSPPLSPPLSQPLSLPLSQQLIAFEIGYWCVHSQQKQGYVTEVVRALTQIAFEQLNATRIQISCDARNRDSQRVAERCGYQYEGCLRNHARANDGTLRATMIYSKIDQDGECETHDEDGHQ